MVAQYSVGLSPPDFATANADVNCSGNINIIDALQIAQFYVGLITSFPGCGATPAPPAPPTPVPLDPGTSNELQAEDANWSSGSVDSDNPGYTGSGYVNTDNSAGEWIEWSINLSAAGSAICEFTYASASEDRAMDLTVNADFVTTLSFPASGAWTAWSKIRTGVNLNVGLNTIRLTATTTGGAPNMDKLDIMQ
jgi:hypothetical protein